MATVASDLVFDTDTNTSTSQNLTNFQVTTSGGVDPVNWSPGDWFGVAAWGTWPQPAGVPFAVADDSVEGISGGGVHPTIKASSILVHSRRSLSLAPLTWSMTVTPAAVLQ